MKDSYPQNNESADVCKKRIFGAFVFFNNIKVYALPINIWRFANIGGIIMEKRILTKEKIKAFFEYLKTEEKSENTIKNIFVM